MLVRRNLTLQRKEADDSDSSMLKIKVQKRLAVLLGKIRKFRQLQATYMPQMPASGSDSSPSSQSAPSALPPKALTVLDVDTFIVVLPSDLTPEQRTSVCGANLPHIEDQLQYADACDALEDLRHSLRMRTCYNQDKIANVTGQVPNTKARSLQSSVDQAVKNAAHRYRSAREAIQRLRGPGPWQDVLRPLLDADLVGLNERALTREEAAERDRVRALGEHTDDAAGVPLSGSVYIGEGRRTLSWIWYSGESGATEGGDDFGLSEGTFTPFVFGDVDAEPSTSTSGGMGQGARLRCTVERASSLGIRGDAPGYRGHSPPSAMVEPCSLSATKSGLAHQPSGRRAVRGADGLFRRTCGDGGHDCGRLGG